LYGAGRDSQSAYRAGPDGPLAFARLRG
jgi:hypothetical protein